MKKRDRKKISRHKKSTSNSYTKNKPLGVILISIYDFLHVVIYGFLGLVTVFTYIFWDRVLASSNQPLNISKHFLLTFGLFWLVLAVMFFSIGINLLKLRRWSRIAHLFIYIFFFLVNLSVLFSDGWIFWFSIFDVIFSGAVVLYLGFNKEASKSLIN